MEEIIEFKVNRIKAAFAIAIVADLLEFPITWLEHFEWEIVRLLAQAANVLIDCAVMWAMTKLLGYHWLFWPTFFVEVIPQVDMFPTWIACVAYVVHERKKSQTQPGSQSPQPRPIIDVDQIKAVGASLASRLTLPQSNAPDGRTAIRVETTPSVEVGHEDRLKRLTELRDKNLISQSEYDTKRQQILADI
jgi:hypothetical protein